MAGRKVPKIWVAAQKGGSWAVKTKAGKLIATVTNTGRDEEYATLMAASPYMRAALEAVARLIGDEDLPDNGELIGAAISDMVRSAIEMVTGSLSLTQDKIARSFGFSIAGSGLYRESASRKY